MNKNTTQDMKNELVRDMTKVFPMAKSEARRRLDTLIDDTVRMTEERIVEDINESILGSTYSEGYMKAIKDITNLIKQNENSRMANP